MEIGGTGFASIAFGYPNALWGEPQSPGQLRKERSEMFFAGMALGAMTGAAFGIGTDVLCGCWKAEKISRWSRCGYADKNRENQNRSSSEIWKGQSGSPFWMGKVFA